MNLIYNSIKGIFCKLIIQLKSFDEKSQNTAIYKYFSFLPRKLLRGYRWLRNRGFKCAFRTVLLKFSTRSHINSPLVSIVLPVYNVEPYLEQCMDSLLRQSLKAIEIIAVDDGSTDRSLEILYRYAAKDNRIRVLTQKNKYAGAARNLGLANATGEYIIFLDPDDFFDKNLARDAYISGKAINADIVLFDAREFDNSTEHPRASSRFLFNYLAPQKQPFSYRDCPDKLFQITTPCPWTKLFRRQFVLDSGLQFQAIQNTNDLYFTLSALPMAERIVTLNKSLVFYRVGLTSNLQTTKQKHPLCFYEAYLAWHNKLAELDVLNELRQSYSNITLDGCLFNLHTQNSQDSQKEVFKKLKYEAFDNLELIGYDQSFFYSKENFLEMMNIINSRDSL